MEDAEDTPRQRVFSDEKPVYLYMKPKPVHVGKKGVLLSLPAKCRELGIDTARLKRDDLKIALKNYWVEQVFDGNVQEYLRADCFQGERQAIDHLRKPTSNTMAKKAFAAKAHGQKKAPKPSKRTPMCIEVSEIVVATIPHKTLSRPIF